MPISPSGGGRGSMCLILQVLLARVCWERLVEEFTLEVSGVAFSVNLLFKERDEG